MKHFRRKSLQLNCTNFRLELLNRGFTGKKSLDFEVEVTGDKVTIKPVLFRIEYAILHEVWKDNQLLYSLEPGLSAHGIPGFNLTNEYIGQLMDKRLVAQIGEAIKKHDL